MKKILLLLSAITVTPSFAETTVDNSAYFQKSREAVQTLGSTLKHHLMSTMKTGGAVAAVAVCNTKAEIISEQISLDKGITITRTSNKYRNVNNAPDQWERAVLNQFEERKKQGKALKTMEFGEVITNKDGIKQFRYLKAIATGEPCLACHGENIKPNTKKLISTLYPNDKASGFKLGDLRGAFSVTVPLQF